MKVHVSRLIFMLVALVASNARACENVLDDRVTVSFDDVTRAKAGFSRVGTSRFWWRDTFVLEDLGTGRGRIWLSHFNAGTTLRFSPRVSLRKTSDEDGDLFAVSALITAGWARGKYATSIERRGSTTTSVRGEAELDLSKFATGRRDLAEQLATAGFEREGNDDTTWIGSSTRRGRTTELVALIDDRDELLVVAPATLKAEQTILRDDLRLGLAENDPHYDLTLGNDRLRFALRDNGYAVDVVWTADLNQISSDDPVFGRPAAARSTTPTDRRLSELAEPFAKLAMLHARQLLGDRVQFGDLDVLVERGDRRSLHTSRFDDFQVNTGAMTLTHPRSGKRLTLGYLAAYEAFAYGSPGRRGDRETVDPRALAEFWAD